MSGRYALSSARSVARLLNVQSKTLVSMPRRAQLGGQRGDAERRKEHLVGRPRANVRKDERHPAHAAPLRGRPLTSGLHTHGGALAKARLAVDGQRTRARGGAVHWPRLRGDKGANVHATARRNEVLLVFPGRFKAPDPQVPLQLLHVAGALQRAGYRPRIVDMRLADYRTLPIGEPVFVGLTCMSGPQIRYALEFAARVRAERPRRAHRVGRRAPHAAARTDRRQRGGRRGGARRGRDGRRPAGRPAGRGRPARPTCTASPTSSTAPW